MEIEKVKYFVDKWIRAWNEHDMDLILGHYAEDVEFHSPFILLLQFNDKGVIKGKLELRRYFSAGLATYPNLYFKLHHFFVGVHTVVIYYTSVKGKLAAETFELDEAGHAVKVYCNYADA